MLLSRYLKLSAVAFCMCAVFAPPTTLLSQDSRLDARATSLGGSLVTQARDATALFWNPASLAGLKDRSVLMRIDDPFQFNFIGINHFVPIYGTFAASMSRIPTDSSRVDRGTFGWGLNLNRFFSMGASLNVEKLDKGLFASGGLGFYLGNPTVGTAEWPWRQSQHGTLWDRLGLGLVVNSIPLGNNLFDTSVRIGASYVFPSPGLLASFGYHLIEGENTAHLGVGANVGYGISILAGVEQFDSDKLGIGLEYRNEKIDIQGAYSPHVDELLLTMSVRLSTGPSYLAARIYEDGQRLLREHRYSRANHELRKFVSYGTAAARADSTQRLLRKLGAYLHKTQIIVDSLFTETANYLAQRGPQFLRAALVLKRILELDPDNERAIRQLDVLEPTLSKFVEKSVEEGIAEFEANRYVSARRAFRRALVFDEDNGPAKNYLMRIAQELSVIAEDYFYRGVGYYRQENYEKALAELEKALEYNPQSVEAQSYLQRVRQKVSQRRERVLKLLAEGLALEQQNKFVDATLKYGDVLRIDKQNQKAHARLEHLRPRLDDYLSARFAEGLRYKQRGELEKASAIFNRILSIDPKHRGARRNLSNILAQKQDRASFYIGQADVLRSKGKLRSALQQYGAALQIDPANTRALKGREETEAALEIERLIGQAAKEDAAGNFANAAHVLEHVLELDPGNQTATDRLSRVKSKMQSRIERYFIDGIDAYTRDQYQESIRRLNKVLELDPKHKGALEYIRKARERLSALRRLH